MSTVENELVGKAGKLSPADADFCKKETQNTYSGAYPFTFRQPIKHKNSL